MFKQTNFTTHIDVNFLRSVGLILQNSSWKMTVSETTDTSEDENEKPSVI